jgi:class 3 adenylate cyclase
MRCPNCGTENPSAARFCMSCGASLAQAAPQERRTVSILFADLVGFTERSDTADPEDVRRTLVPFHQRAKRSIERFGGTLDKFIGDAAMGVFGAPIEHEDDPERAVRAALDLLVASTGDRPIRVAVNTGEAIVSMGAGPQVGEAVAGDVVNTASRMQSASLPGGLVIGELTWAAVRDRFEVEELDPFTAKGKAEPVRLWRVVGERAVLASGPTAPLIGRAQELAMLREAIERTAAERRGHLVTMLADAGIGKSRLVAELRADLGDDVTWLEGACAPYGDASPLAPLADAVRALAGAGASDDPAEVSAALAELVARVEPDPTERDWLATRLAIVAVGAARDREQQVPVAEVGGAVATVLAGVATDRPVVLAIDDLHWSERVLRDVLVAIVDEVDAPVTVLCTSRPELADVDPTLAQRPNDITIRLLPLGDAETAALVEALLASAMKPDADELPVLANVGGNPLFAVEFVRMLVERRQPADPATLPISVQAVIGARLDSVGPEPRSRLQDAAVVGSRFWPGALVAAGEVDPDAVGRSLDELGHRGLIVHGASSWFPGEKEYGFGHTLIREVAYARLPRLARAHKHALVAAWLDSVVGERRGSFADALGHHWEQAVLLAVAAGERAEADRWRLTAGEALLEAGLQTLGLDPAGAFDRLQRALAIVPEDEDLYTKAMSYSALAGRRSGMLDREEVLDRYRRAAVHYHERGAAVEEARARANVGGQLMALARGDEARAELATAADLLEDHPEAAAELAHVYAWLAEEKMFAGDAVAAAALADRSLSTGDARDPVRIMALHIRGDSRIAVGDGAGGAADLREALVRAEALGSVAEITTTHSYLADYEWQVDGPAAALERLDDASALADRRGAVSQSAWTKASALELLFELGRWDELLARAPELAAIPNLDESLVVAVAMWPTIVHLRRGEPVGALDELVAAARTVEELQVLAPALAIAAEAAFVEGDAARAVALAREFEIATRDKAAIYRSEWAPSVARLAIANDAPDLVRDLVGHSEPTTMRDELFCETAAALLREADGAAEPEVWADLERRWETYGDVYERGQAALALGRSGDAEAGERGRSLLATLGVPA